MRLVDPIPADPDAPPPTDRELLELVRRDIEHVIACCAGRNDGSPSADGYRVVGEMWLPSSVLWRLDEAGIVAAPKPRCPIVDLEEA